jgi:hypothetical protein
MPRIRKQIQESNEQLARERELLEMLRAQNGSSQAALDAAQRRQPAVESLVGFLVGKREQNGFGRDYRITLVDRTTERHA